MDLIVQAQSIVFSRLAKELVVCDVYKYVGLSNTVIQSVKRMISYTDYGLFKDMQGKYQPCKSTEEYTQLLLNNLPLGVKDIQFKITVHKDFIASLIKSFYAHEDFQNELVIRLSNF